MPLNTNKKILDLKTWDMCAPSPIANPANAFIIGSDGPAQGIMYVVNATTVWLYYPLEDAWVQLASPALSGTFGAGVAGTYHFLGPTGTAQAGTGAGQIVTNLTILADLSPKLAKPFKGRITAGTGAGQDFVITGNTTGANSTVFLTAPGGAPLSTAPDNTSVYALYTGKFYVLSAGTLAAGSFKSYDYATATWASLSNTGLLANWISDGRMCSTSAVSTAPFATGTATAGGSTSISNTAKTWTVNQWANFQVRITGGTGAGQTRLITSNTATALTTSAFAVAPDVTSVYSIEGNDDAIYLIGAAAVTLYRYSIQSNTWVTITPAVARSGVVGPGLSLHWIHSSDAPNWSNESNIINGRRIYSFRGNGSNLLDYYDIPSNSWVAVTYGRQVEVINTGASCAFDGKNRIICQISPVINQPVRFVAFDVREQALVPISSLLYPSGTITLGDKAVIQEYDDGVGEPIKFLYQLRHSGTEFHRCDLF